MELKVISSNELVTGTTAITSVSKSGNESIISGFGGNDTLAFKDGKVMSAAIRGDDVVLTLDYDAYVRIKNAKGRYLHINDSDGAHYLQYGGKYTYTPLDVIQSFMGSLDKTTLSGSNALDEAVQACSKKFSTIKEAIAKCVEDCKSAGDATTFLRKYCGIELNDADTGAITGWDAANPYSKDNDNIVPESGAMKTFTGSEFDVSGLKLTIPPGLTDVQQQIVNGLYTWWTKEGLALISESYGKNFGFDSSSSATVKEMNVQFVNDKKNFLALVSYSYNPSNGKSSALTLKVNMRYYNSLAADNVNGKSSDTSAGYLDRVLAHEFTHAVMAANIDYFSKLPQFIVEGMAELTHGIDDHRYNTILEVAGSSSKLNSNLNLKDTSTGKNTAYAAGYIFLRYLAKQSAIFEKDYDEVFDPNNPPVADESSDGIAYSDSKFTKLIVSDYLGVVDASDFNSKLVTIDAGLNDQFIALIGNANNNVLRAGSDGSSLDGGLGADKLYGGGGADTFSYTLGDGADQIFYFNGYEGDVLQIFGDNSISKANFKDSSGKIVLTIGSGKTKGTITFNSTTGVIKVVDSTGSLLTTFNEPPPDGVTLDSKKTKMTVGSPFSGELDLKDYSTVKDVDASSATAVVTLIGNAQANVIKSGSNGGYLDGGLGADKLYGGSGADTFAYSVGSGADQIFNFNGYDNDVVQIFGDNSINRASFKDNSGKIILTVGNGTKQKGTITFSSTTGLITVVDASGNILTTFNEPPPDGVTLDSKKTKMTVSSPFSGELDLKDYSTVKEVDASKATAAVTLVGNAQANVIKSGSNGGYLDGGLGADKLYGGGGADTFSYSVGGGADQIFNFNGSQGDVVQIFGDSKITRESFKDNGKTIVLTVGNGTKQKGTITFSSTTGLITVVDSVGSVLTTFNEPPPDGVTLDSKKTKMTVGAPFNGELDLKDYSTVKEVDASKATAAVTLVGNAQANVLKAASAVGSYLDGGTGADKLYGGGGADTFSYSVGGGADQIFNFNGSQGDVVQIFGDSKITRESFKDNGKTIVLTVGNGTKQKSTITFSSTTGLITVVDSVGSVLTTFNEPPPDGVTLDSKKTKMTVGSPFSGELDLKDYSTVKEVDASKATAAVTLVGNAQANVLTASSVGSYLDGDKGADKLYGGSGADTFAYSVGGGADQIFNFNGYDNDVVQIFGDNSINRASFKDSSGKIILTVGTGKTKGTITFNSTTGLITVVDSVGSVLTTYNEPPPDGVTLDSKKTKMTVGAPFSGELDLSNYASTIKDVDASKSTEKIYLIGSATANTLRGGTSESTLYGGHPKKAVKDVLVGGTGADTFLYADGDGADVINNYEYAQGDLVSIGGEVKSASVSGKNVVLKVGSGSLTINNVVDKTVSINISGTVGTYQFTKTNNTLEKARLSTAAQLPTEEYWFTSTEEEASLSDGGLHASPLDGDPLSEILSIDNNQIDLPSDFDETFRTKSEAITYAARHRPQK